jgi:DNA-binding MarR family transcriptional regulator
MPRTDPADPFSTFLHTAGRNIGSRGDADRKLASEVGPLPPEAVSVLVQVGRKGRASVDELRRGTGLTSLRVAEVVRTLSQLDLVTIRGKVDDDWVTLTSKGRTVLGGVA